MRLEATGSVALGGVGAGLPGHTRRSVNQMIVWNESAGNLPQRLAPYVSLALVFCLFVCSF